MRKIKVNGIYRHFKGNYYIVESSDDGSLVFSDICIDPENEEEIERAIDEIIQYDFMNIYKKVRKSDTKSV